LLKAETVICILFSCVPFSTWNHFNLEETKSFNAVNYKLRIHTIITLDIIHIASALVQNSFINVYSFLFSVKKKKPRVPLLTVSRGDS